MTKIMIKKNERKMVMIKKTIFLKKYKIQTNF